MKSVVKRSAFLKSLTRIARIVEDEPMLKDVLLTADDGALALHASALDFEITDTIPSEVGQSGSISMSARLLLEHVRILPDGSQISLAFDEGTGRLIIGDGRTASELKAIEGRHFGALGHDTFTHAFTPTFTVPSRGILRLFGDTVIAPASDENPFTLEGVRLHMPTASTEGMDRGEVPGLPGSDGKAVILVPCTTVAELMRLLDDDMDVAVEVNDESIRFVVGAVLLTSRLIDAPYAYF